MCFSPEGFLFNEADAIFYKQFKESQTYLRIAKLLNQGPMTLDAISRHLKFKSGGGLRTYLENLELAEIIKSYNSFGTKKNSKYKKYKLVEPVYEPWFGIAFERFCFKYSDYIAQKIGFADEVLSVSPFFSKTDLKFQIDMIYERADNIIVVTEVKYSEKEITPKIITEIEKKLDLLKVSESITIQKFLISLRGPNKALQAAEYFDHTLELKEIF